MYTDENGVNLENALLMVDSHHGIYIPQIFVKNVILDESTELNWQNGSQDQIDTAIEDCKNPDNEFYWESWEWIIDNLLIYNQTTERHMQIYHSEDCWLVYPENFTE